MIVDWMSVPYLDDLSNDLGLVVLLIPILSVKTYFVQIDGFPFELWPALGQLTSASS